MIKNDMNLQSMLNYAPSDYELMGLPLDIVLYCKLTIVSNCQQDNYDFIRFLFCQEEMTYYFKDIKDTIIYDFDGRNTKQERYISILELFSLYNFENTSQYLKDTLEKYDHQAEVFFDFYTHDSKAYRLSNLDGIVKLEEMQKLA